MTTQAKPSHASELAFRQRGFNDGRYNRDVKAGELLAERAGCLTVYREGVRAGVREREKS